VAGATSGPGTKGRPDLHPGTWHLARAAPIMCRMSFLRTHASASPSGRAAETSQAVVLVEDDAGLRAALTRVLELAGFRVESFATAEGVLAAAAAARACCIVCDVVLPGQSGLSLCRQLARGGRRVPTIFITALDQPAIRAEAEALGAADYLVKPFEGRRLVEAVRAAMLAP